MKLCYTVYRIGTYNCQMCHANLTVIDDCHLCDLLMVARVGSFDFLYKAAVDLLNDSVNTRKQT